MARPRPGAPARLRRGPRGQRPCSARVQPCFMQMGKLRPRGGGWGAALGHGLPHGGHQVFSSIPSVGSAWAHVKMCSQVTWPRVAGSITEACHKVELKGPEHGAGKEPRPGEHWSRTTPPCCSHLVQSQGCDSGLGGPTCRRPPAHSHLLTQARHAGLPGSLNPQALPPADIAAPQVPGPSPPAGLAQQAPPGEASPGLPF